MKLSRRALLQLGALSLVGLARANAQAPKLLPPPPPPLEPAPKLRRVLKEGTTCSTARDAVELAVDDLKQLIADEGDPTLTRYVWIPDWIEPQCGFEQVAHVVNSTITRTSTRPRPRLVQHDATTLVAIELDRYAASEKQIPDIVKLYEKLAARDSWFNTEVLIDHDTAVEVTEELRIGQAVEIRLRDGKWGAAVYKAKKGSLITCEYQGKLVDMAAADVRSGKSSATARRVFTSHAYLNPIGAELFTLTCSSVPIMRLDEWVAFTFSSVNGGLYYELAGVLPTLGETIARYAGADAAKKVLRTTERLRLASVQHHKPGEQRSIFDIAAEFDPELAKSKAIMNESQVTHRQRAFLFVWGANVPPAEGTQLVAITFDLAEDNTSPDSDPQRQLSTYETYNGGEAILSLPNGMLLYLVFDAQDKIIDRVPDNVAWDNKAHEVRGNVGTVRVFSGVSCANCHEAASKNFGWQPVGNEIAEDYRSLTKILGDRPKKLLTVADKEKLQELQRLASAYNADDLQIEEMLLRSGLFYQRAVKQATGASSSRGVIAGLADSYWSYWYDAVWPEHIVRDLGHVLSRKDAQAFLLNRIPPNPHATLIDFLKEDRIVDRAKKGKSNMPSQYRPVAPELAERLLFPPPGLHP